MELDEFNSSIGRASHVVGIGASAGGLEAMLDLLRALPATLGIAYIFLQHLDPHHAPAAPLIGVRLTTGPGVVTCSVQDGGPGIALDKQTHLFKRFSRIGSGHAEASQGLGLGLYLVAQLVECHGGAPGWKVRRGKGPPSCSRYP